jgi:predicted DNA-binding transcriptional regulator AlpA
MLATNQPFTAAAQSPLVPLLTAEQVRLIFGGISPATLYRWINDANLKFPKPKIIGRRRFWHPAEVESFARSMGEAT